MAFPLPRTRDDATDRRAANRAVGVSAVGLAATGLALQVEVEGWVDPDLTVRASDALGREVADAIARDLPETGSLTWTSRAAPS